MAEAITLFFDHIGSYIRIYICILFPSALLSLVGYYLPESSLLSLSSLVVSIVLGLIGGIYLLSFSAHLGDKKDTKKDDLLSFQDVMQDSKKIIFAPIIPLIVFLITFSLAVFFFLSIALRLFVDIAPSGFGYIYSIPAYLLGLGGVLSMILCLLSYYALYFSIFYAIHTHDGDSGAAFFDILKKGYILALQNWWILLILFLILSLISSMISGVLSLIDLASRWGDAQVLGSSLGLSTDISTLTSISSLQARLSGFTQEDILNMFQGVSRQNITSICTGVVRDFVSLMTLSITFLVYSELTKKYIQKLTAHI